MKPTREEIHAQLLQRFSRGISAAKAAREINEFYGNIIVGTSTAQEWFHKFKIGNTRIKRKRGSGRPRKVDRSILRHRFLRNPDGSTRKLAGRYCGRMTVWRWLRKVGRNWRKQHQIPYEMSGNIQAKRKRTCHHLWSEYRHGRLPLSNIITHDQTWIFYDGRVLQRQWLKKGQVGKMVPKRNIHGKKRMLCVYWCSTGALFWELLKPREKSNTDVYLRHMQKVEQKVERLLYENKWNGPVFVLQDGASSHKSERSIDFVKDNLHWNIIPHAPYSPDIAPSDYHLFLSLKDFLRGKKSEDESELEDELNDYFRSRPLGFYERGIGKLPKRWRKVINSSGKYII